MVATSVSGPGHRLLAFGACPAGESRLPRPSQPTWCSQPCASEGHCRRHTPFRVALLLGRALCRARCGPAGSLVGCAGSSCGPGVSGGREDSPPAWEPSDAGACPQDVARLIVERSTIMSHLFSKRSCSAESDAVLAALLSIFSRYVRRMRKSKDGEEVYSWVRRAAAPPQPQPRPAPPRPALHARCPCSPSLRTRSSCAGPAGRQLPCTSWWSTPWSSC